MRRALSIAALTALVLMSTSGRAVADDWIEVKSAHFTVVSNAGDRTTRRLVWQLEQVLNGVCSDGEMEACTQLALLVAAGRTEADLLRTRELLTKACGGQHARACELLKTRPKPAK